MSRDHDRRDYERDRVVYERDRDRRGDERVRYEEDDEYLAYDINRRPAHAPTRVRERSPTPPGRRGDERFIQRERRFVHDDDNDNDSLILPASARRRAPPPAVIPDDFDDRRPGGGGSRVTVDRERVRIREGEDSIIGSSAGGPPPPRPGRLIRRQSSVETFDRRPARRAYELDRVEGGRPPVNVPIPLPIRRRRGSSAERREHEYERERDRYIERERDRERGRDRERERDRTEIEEIRIEPGRIEVDDVEIDWRRRRESFERHERDRHERERDRIVETERIEKSTYREDERRGRPVVYDQEVAKRVVHDYRRSEMMVGRSPSVSSEGSITSVRTGRSSGGITLRSEQGASKSIGKSEYPKKGKTRMPARLVSEQVLIDLHYPFIKEGNTLVLQVALGQDNIDDVLKLSRDYKKNETDIIETKTTKVKTSGGTVIEEERRREEVFTTPSGNQPPPVQHYQPPPIPPPPPQMYQPQQVYYTAPPPAQYEYAPVVVPAPDPVERSPAYSTTNIHIRDASPARSYTTTMPSMNETSVALVRTARSRSRGPPPGMSMALAPVIYDVGSPAVEVAEEPLAVAVVDNRRRSKSRHRHRHSHSHSTHRRARSHSHGGDGALFAHFHDRRDRDDRYYDVTVDDRYYREERDYHDAPSSGRELVRAERLSTGELVLYQEQVERVEEPRYGVRIEKDKKGRMAISVPKYR